MDPMPNVSAHAHSSNHRGEILSSEVCGCFYCMHIFLPTEILDWIDDNARSETEIEGVRRTALCPKCGIDSVIGSKSGYPITTEFLQTMHQHWF